MAPHYRTWFPNLGSPTSFVRQAANLWVIPYRIHRHLSDRLKAPPALGHLGRQIPPAGMSLWLLRRKAEYYCTFKAGLSTTCGPLSDDDMNGRGLKGAYRRQAFPSGCGKETDEDIGARRQRRPPGWAEDVQVPRALLRYALPWAQNEETWRAHRSRSSIGPAPQFFATGIPNG